MKSENRVRDHKPGTEDWKVAYDMLLDDGVTCNECIHVERCCGIFGQKPYVNKGECQFHPNRFTAKPDASIKYICPVCQNEEHPIDANYCKICGEKIKE